MALAHRQTGKGIKHILLEPVSLILNIRHLKSLILTVIIPHGSNFTSANYGRFRLRIVSSYGKEGISIASYNCTSLADYK